MTAPPTWWAVRSRAAPLRVRERRAAVEVVDDAVALAARMAVTLHPQLLPGPPVDGLHGFQAAAVARARVALERYGGVLVADDVGLGKTHVALALLADARSPGASTLVVSPAALRAHWARHLPPSGWISYSRLSRLHARGRAPRADLVVFDEAHALRSARTLRYDAAAALADGARVVLLTATPVNNRLGELYRLIRLFAGDGAFRDVGVADLRGAFERADAPDGAGVDEIRPVLRAVMIRRARRDVAGELAGHGVVFPRRAPPIAVRYAQPASDGGRDVLVDAAAAVAGLAFPAHRAAGIGAGAPVDLMRLSLLKRLESSVHALRSSLARYEEVLRGCEDGLRAGRLPTPAELRAALGSEQLGLLELTAAPVATDVDAAALERDVAAERATVRALLARLSTITPGRDAKLEALRTLLERELGGHAVVVFTEFADTAEYLARALAAAGGVGLVTGRGARLGERRAGRADVIRRFAWRTHGLREPPAAERVRLLVATDVLSEGLDLHDADAVVSYDLPWNPIRLVQRVGRVDRLGSRHDIVRSWHFVPGELEAYVRLVRRLRRKLAGIDAAVGLAAPVLHEDVALRVAAGDAALFDDVEAGRPLVDLDAGRLTDLVREGAPAPLGSRDGGLRLAVAGAGDVVDAAVVVYRNAGKIGAEAWSATEPVTPEAVLLRAASAAGCDADPLALAEAALRQLRPAIARRVALRRDSRVPDGTAADAARALLGALAAIPGGPPLELCARADASLARLTAGCAAGAERRLRTALDDRAGPPRPPARRAATLMEAIDAAAPTTPRPTDDECVEILALLVLARAAEPPADTVDRSARRV